MNQKTLSLICPGCKNYHPVAFQYRTKRRLIKESIEYQNNNFCPKCLGQDETASRELQASGLKDMYRAPEKKPAILTNYDSQGKPKKEWLKPESKTERALRECSADNTPITVERYWFEGTLEAFMSL
jgi:hypothetical protein